MTNQKKTATTGDGDGFSGTVFHEHQKADIYENGLLVKTESIKNGEIIETTEYFYNSDIAPAKLLRKVTDYK